MDGWHERGGGRQLEGAIVWKQEDEQELQKEYIQRFNAEMKSNETTFRTG
jgi:hypothetical protein